MQKQSAIYDTYHTVQAEQLDVLGCMSRVAYIALMQQIAAAHDQHLGLDWAIYQQLKHAMMETEHYVQFRKAVAGGQKLLLRTWVADVNAFQVVRYFAFFDAQTGDLLFTGQGKWACVELASLKVKRLSPTFTQAYRALSSDINPYDVQQLWLCDE
ncbi:MAG: thioesterase [Acinetobacter sp.]|nr:thioesterase [Acinetobacter sp.]